MALKPVLEETKEKFKVIIANNRLGNESVQVTVGTLSAKQAIGAPNRQDFALLEGKEVMIEAQFQGSLGQAFTNQPHSFTGLLNDVLSLSLNTNNNRAIFVATVNAVASHLGMVTGVRHCRDEEPEKCGSQIAQYIETNFGRVKVGLIGLQPAILENLSLTFGANNVRCTDLNPKNVGSQKFGVEIWDGRTETANLTKWCNLLLVTSSTMVNNTFDAVREEAISQDTKLIVFGVTGAGVSTLLGLERVCFQAH
ncbi:Rossmann-like domain-containing protein [Chloroflexota bacterium]